MVSRMYEMRPLLFWVLLASCHCLKLFQGPIRPSLLAQRYMFTPALPLLLHTLRLQDGARTLASLLQDPLWPFDLVYLEDFGRLVYRRRYSQLQRKLRMGGCRSLIPLAGLDQVKFRVGEGELAGIDLFDYDQLILKYMPQSLELVKAALLGRTAMIQARNLLSMLPADLYKESLCHWSLIHYSCFLPSYVSPKNKGPLLMFEGLSSLANSSHWLSKEPIELDDSAEVARYCLQLCLVIAGYRAELSEALAAIFVKFPVQRLEEIIEANIQQLPSMRFLVDDLEAGSMASPPIQEALQELGGMEEDGSRWTLALLDLYWKRGYLDWTQPDDQSRLIEGLKRATPLEVSHWIEMYLKGSEAGPTVLPFARDSMCKLVRKHASLQNWLLQSHPDSYFVHGCIPLHRRLKETRSLLLQHHSLDRHLHQLSRSLPSMTDGTHLDVTRVVREYWERLVGLTGALQLSEDGQEVVAVALFSGQKLAQLSMVVALQTILTIPSGLYPRLGSNVLLALLFGFPDHILPETADFPSLLSTVFHSVELLDGSIQPMGAVEWLDSHSTEQLSSGDRKPACYKHEVMQRLEKAAAAARSVLGDLLSFEEILSLIQ